jgi:hypothetical protein
MSAALLFVSFFLLILAVAGALAFRSLRKKVHLADLEAQKRSDDLFRQIEGLLAVHAVVGQPSMLPRSRGWAASPDFLQVLIGQVRDHGTQVVLECSSGLSTVVAAALCRNRGSGRVYSLEHDPIYAAKTRRLLAAHRLDQWAEVIDAPLVPTALDDWSGQWYDLSRVPDDVRAGLLVVDGPPSTSSPLARYPALPALRSRLAGGARVLLDDADREDEREIVRRWLRREQGARAETVDRCEKGCAVLVLP